MPENRGGGVRYQVVETQKDGTQVVHLTRTDRRVAEQDRHLLASIARQYCRVEETDERERHRVAGR